MLFRAEDSSIAHQSISTNGANQASSSVHDLATRRVFLEKRVRG